jgi:hypothetical protein
MARFMKKLGGSPERFIFELLVHTIDIKVPYEV